MSISVLIVEDEPIIASDIEMTLKEDDYSIAGIAHSSTKAIDMLHRTSPDIVLLDIAIQGDKDGIDIAHLINDKYKLPFIYITSFADKETLTRAKSTLPYGYIVKPFKDRDIISTIEMAVYRFAVDHNHHLPPIESLPGLAPLTPGEFQVLQCVWEGSTNKMAADKLSVSINTVKTHLKSIFAKLEVRSRNEAIAVIRKSK